MNIDLNQIGNGALKSIEQLKEFLDITVLA